MKNYTIVTVSGYHFPVKDVKIVDDNATITFYQGSDKNAWNKLLESREFHGSSLFEGSRYFDVVIDYTDGRQDKLMWCYETESDDWAHTVVLQAFDIILGAAE